MRFAEIKEFNVDELLLDEGNYRFKKANSQEACIEKIYQRNPQYFKGLMKSIAEDDLGELLLVYKNSKDENIVLDGNRRLSAFKALYNDKYLPKESLKDYADELRANNEINFSNIVAQVSNDRKLILKTVYERHASSKDGRARIGWSALAAARFRFDEKIDDKEWYTTAILFKAEEKNPYLSDFLDGNNYSHEVFRRIVRAAFDRHILSKNIFSERDQRIKSSAAKNLLDDAVSKVCAFLQSMENKEITLSRADKDNYADKSKIDKYLDGFSLSPDNQRLEDTKPQEAKASPIINTNSNTNSNTNESKEIKSEQKESSAAANQNESTSNEKDTTGNTRAGGNGIDKSFNIAKKLDTLQLSKLTGLYNSLCTISLNAHPQLMYVGAWSFLECVCDAMGKTDGTDFISFLDSKLNKWSIEKGKRKGFKESYEDISKKGNATKHRSRYDLASALQLRKDFINLEPLILRCLDELISQNQGAA